MKIKILEESDEKLTFVADEINPSFANALRRAMMGEVPALAIDEVDIHENSSALYNEVLSHRLALVPLAFDPKKVNIREECVCEGKGCVECQVVLVLKKEGPCTVYTKDLKSSDEDVKPLYDSMPLVMLLEGQKVELEATARLGRGREHAKWQAAVASYKYYPKVTIKPGLPEEDAKKILDVCPTNVFERSGRGARVANELACILCDACVEASPQYVEVKGDETKFVFRVETVCGLKPEQIVSLALENIEAKAKELEEKVSEYA
ncbi:MAG: DNA-directed RNA polymerase subunit D [Candidatus Aenigmatarchaeota archaeon]|nr:MAG: DNA-directed RNA polymerase subunit D [Candidatus Aenigmarchaeota archaeon]